MKIKTIHSILFIFAFNFLAAQDTLMFYFNEDGIRTADKKVAFYYRKGFLDSTGAWVAKGYYMNNKIQMIGTYTSKEFQSRHGHFVYYFENGKKKSEGGCLNDLNVGLWTYWYESGGKKSEGKMVKNKKEDVWVNWHENGVKESEGKYENGKGEGKWTGWYDNGQKKTEGMYLNYARIGVWKFWDENGDLDFEENYESGKLFFITWYYPGGEKRAKGFYSGDNKKNAEWLYWNIDERTYLKGSYLNGEKHGEWTRYFENGESMKIYYENGILKDQKLGGIIVTE